MRAESTGGATAFIGSTAAAVKACCEVEAIEGTGACGGGADGGRRSGSTTAGCGGGGGGPCCANSAGAARKSAAPHVRITPLGPFLMAPPALG